MVLSNAYSNAVLHGETNGPIQFEIEADAANGLLGISMMNYPGQRHEENRTLQADKGNHATGELLDLLVGQDDSTFLGLKEISIVSALMRAQSFLCFEEQEVVFTLSLPLEIAERAQAERGDNMPVGSVLIAVDDDLAPRLQYQDLIEAMSPIVDQKASIVLGKSYAEVVNIVQIVLEAIEKSPHSDRGVVCIFDQNIAFTEGTICGTDVTIALRESGFKGLIFIRSAMDDFYSVEKFRKAGATANLSKDSDVSQLMEELKQHYQSEMRHIRSMLHCSPPAKGISDNPSNADSEAPSANLPTPPRSNSRVWNGAGTHRNMV